MVDRQIGGRILFRFLFLLLPLAGLLIRAPWGRLGAALSGTDATQALTLSLWTATVSTAISMIIGVPLAWVLAWMLLACCPRALALNPSLDVSQYAHTAWRVQDGAPGAVRDLAQGADGLLWIASERGLFQFDGRQATPTRSRATASSAAMTPSTHGSSFLAQ